MDPTLIGVLVFKLFRTETATPTVISPAIVITFDIIKRRCPHCFPPDNVFSVDTFHFQRSKELFHAGIIVAAALCAHKIILSTFRSSFLSVQVFSNRITDSATLPCGHSESVSVGYHWHSPRSLSSNSKLISS